MPKDKKDRENKKTGEERGPGKKGNFVATKPTTR